MPVAPPQPSGPTIRAHALELDWDQARVAHAALDALDACDDPAPVLDALQAFCDEAEHPQKRRSVGKDRVYAIIDWDESAGKSPALVV